MAKTRKGWGFDLKNIDSSVRPQDDFYHYAVGRWLKTHSIPPTESRWGSFLILRYKTDAQLRSLLERTAALKRVAPGSPEQMIRDLYRSGMDMKTRSKLGLKPIAPLRDRIKSIENRNELIELIADFHRVGIGVFWGSGVDQDFNNADRNCLHIFQSGLGMPERDYYLKDATEQNRVRNAYLPYMRDMLRLAGYSAASTSKASEAIMRIETALARASMKREDLRTPELLHHPHSIAKLGRLTPIIDWKRYLTRIGVDVTEVNVMQTEFLTTSERLLASESLDDIKRYLDWHVIIDFAPLLSAKFVRHNFSFYGTVLSGTKHMKPLWRRVLGTVNGCLGEQVGKLYVKEYFSAAAKRKMNELVDDLFKAFAARIKRLDWMGAATKKKALAKLRAMNHKIGYPDTWKSYRGLVIRPDDYVGNVLRVAEFKHRRDIKKLGKPVDRAEWYDYPQTVNAFYNPGMNDMLFPAAFLQHPFFDFDADDALNYAAVGMAIGHEMTHGFDTSGAKFDARGNLKNWWAAADKRRFEKKADFVKRQFNRHVVEGMNVNGKLTLTENIADLGGLAIAFDAYQTRLKKTGRKDIDGFTPEQRFFLAYAQSEHELRRPEAAKLQLLTDEHSPSITRVNGPLSNMPGFYEAFDVKRGDKLFRTPKDRELVW